MTMYFKSLLFALLGFVIVLTSLPTAAQTIDLGSDEQVYRVLERAGYRRGQITKRSITIITTEACRNGEKYRVKVSILGKITSESRIGSCGRERLTPAQIQEALREQGYRRVEVIGNTPPFYTARGCRDGVRYRLRVNSRGRIESRRQDGNCAPNTSITPEGLRQALRNSGYTRIKLVQTQRPPYQATACRDNQRVELTIGRRGNLRDERVVGRCREAINASDLTKVLKSKGYKEITVLRRNRLPYLAEACRRGDLLELRIDRFGDVSREERVGQCSIIITKEKLAEQLRNEGYSNFDLRETSRGWETQACRGNERFALRYDRLGDRVSDRRVGTCRSQTVFDVLNTLQNRGARNTQLFVEGCFRGTKYRWEFDQLGNRTGRSRVGNCR
ncbi:MAG: hypothetical protein AAGF28_04840 [Pseudomonadota bacterium]